MSATATVIPSLDASSFDDFIDSESQPVIVEFWASWCGPCRALAPRLEQFALANTDQVLVRKLNLDEAPELAAAHGVRSIPTLILFKDGQARSRLVGLHDPSQIESWVRSAL
jgi:thioredoxin 1